MGTEILKLTFLAFLLPALLSFSLTPLIIKLAFKYNLFPPLKPRDIHKKPIPRLGGIVLAFSTAVATLLILNLDVALKGFLFALIFVILFAVFDDILGMSWKIKLVFQIISAFILIGSGIYIKFFTNIFDGTVSLLSSPFQIQFWHHFYVIYPFAFLVTILWIVGLQNVLNFLDGLDGLAAGVSAIGFIILALVSYYNNPFDLNIFLLFMILLGAIIGFLPYNFNPAKIFLGDSGAYFLGTALAAGGILASGKIAVLSLVLGIPILDALWVVGKRILEKRSPFEGDRFHLHFRILDLGFPQRKIVLSYYFFVGLLGVSAFVFRDNAKVIFGTTAFLILIFALISVLISKNQNSRRQKI